ncbi:glycoside hydrolase family 88/105 protein [Plebeiibacterium sediminum]|uniref:Glycoside hydrolase family 88 protein n=1 Tax=Plebeiibacterium sediminum TaxID=2992112 RepID=A0AAE3M6A8_9BACT|nr:glycoside hydrolase family 88 protein [Plebeiobacterium sediminum]MCW3787979.1 glycoside hydrolase family 88 protein [Plebeiobacterium sediminum]
MIRIIAGCLILLFVQCESGKKKEKSQISYSVQLAEAVMQNNPKAWMTDFRSKPRWGYVEGLVCQALINVSEQKESPKYYNYVKDTYVDVLIDSAGYISGYKKESFKLDDINSGKILFPFYAKTNDERYRAAIEILRDQITDQPRIEEGGFWHKQVYTNQMWLDGLYMGLPFYAQYATMYGDTLGLNDITSQLLLVKKHLKDGATGLYYHGWDASKKVYWADPDTGLSENFWGRGVGWLYMALVDVLDFIPKNHKDYNELVLMFQDLTDAIIQFQQEDSGLWWQVMDCPDREGNYQEATASCMFAYGIFKGIQNGLLSNRYLAFAKKAYHGIFKNLVQKDQNGNLEIIDCCAGAGLGPADNPVRDGSYEYYIKEKIRSNDGKAIGPLIMTCLLVENNPDWKVEE